MSPGKPVPVVFQGLEAGMKMFRWIMAVLLILFLLSGIQKVTSGNVGLLMRFGRLQGTSPATQIKQPGLVLALPYPIDSLVQVPVKKEGEVTITEVWKDIKDLAALDKIDPIMEGYCLTGDQNIIQTKVVVKYRITDPIRFRLSMADPDGMLGDVVLAALVRTVAGFEVNDVLRLQRGAGETSGTTEDLAGTVRRRAQERLDEFDSGMKISALEFKEIHPPRHVVAEFLDVQNAAIEMRTQRSEAEGFVAGKIPAAQAESNRLVQAATAYHSSLVSKAKAELSVFEQIHGEYLKNPGLVWQRIFMETFEQMIQNVGKLRFVSPGTRVIVSDVETKP